MTEPSDEKEEVSLVVATCCVALAEKLLTLEVVEVPVASESEIDRSVREFVALSARERDEDQEPSP